MVDICGDVHLVAVLASPIHARMRASLAGLDGAAPVTRHSLNGRYGIFGRDRPDQSALMPRNFTTLLHFSVSSAMSLAKSGGESATTGPPRSPSRGFILGS